MSRNRAPIGEPLRFIREAVEAGGDECVEFPYQKHRKGHGEVRFNGRGRTASSVALMLKDGIDEPPEGMECCHLPQVCHNRACVNPNHWRWGARKGNFSTLTAADVLEIRASTELHRVLAARHNVHRVTISRVKRRVTWKHI